jgi:hypothetical protein
MEFTLAHTKSQPHEDALTNPKVAHVQIKGVNNNSCYYKTSIDNIVTWEEVRKEINARFCNENVIGVWAFGRRQVGKWRER